MITMPQFKLLTTIVIIFISICNVQSQNARLHVEGSFATKVTTTSSDLTLNDTHQVVLVNSPDSKLITLPTAVGIAGRKYTIKKIGVGNVNITTTGLQIIEGAGSYIIFGESSKGFLTLVSDGSNWWIVGRGE